MNHTTNYNLPQWEDTDRVTRADVNAAMSAIDAAIAGAGLKVVNGSYLGNGTYGLGNYVILTFDTDYRLLFLAVRRRIKKTSENDYKLFLIYNSTMASTWTNTDSNVIVDWSSNAVAWHNTNSAAYQLNESGISYAYFAVLAPKT